jgi:hypothetical protein
MSSLGNLLGSIGGDRPPPPPPSRAQNRPLNSAGIKANSTVPKPLSRPTTPSQVTGIKRKAEDGNPPAQTQSKPQTVPASSNAPRRAAAPPLNGPRPSADKAAIPKLQTDKLPKLPANKPSPKSGTSSPKPAPSKGSFAELMARAKALGPQQKTGIITHAKTAPKEKLSRRAEDRRKEEEKLRKDKSGNGGVRKPDSRRSASPVKGGVQDGRIAKPTASKPTYKGTMGMSAGRDRDRPPKKARYDQYLGTDEEDNSDLEEAGDYDDGYESSDMEGGWDDLEREEALALRQAKEDDAKELALENAHKREKEERRRRLAGLASKNRR